MESLIHKYWATWTIQWLCMMALWFAFVSKVELAEALIGVFAAAAAATGHLVIRRRRGFVKFRPKARWFLAFFREPWWVLNGTAVIFRALVRRTIAGKSPDSNFRYVATLQGYIFNLKTTGLASGTWCLTFTVNGQSDPSYQLIFNVK